MSIEPEFEALMPHTITVHRYGGVSAYGVKTVSNTTETYRARVVEKSRMIKNADGQEIVERGKIWIFGDPHITTKDKVILPDGSTALMVFIEHFPDETGDHHQVIHFA